MKTGIYRLDPIGQKVEVSQKDIDFWCNQCQFPIGGKKCLDTESIQACWNEVGSVAGVWHIQHECPFIHIGQKCQCNNFKTIKDAFRACGLEYKESKTTNLTETDIIVHLLDWDKIESELTQKINDGKTYEIRHHLGLVLEPKVAALCDECVGWTPKNQDDKTIILDIYKGNEPLSDGKPGFSISVMPSFEIKISVEELKEYATSETKTLKDFMGKRYNYNDRIRGNTYNFMRYFNGKD